MEIVDSVPRGANSEGHVGGLALKERVVDVSLKFGRLWYDWGSNGGIHERKRKEESSRFTFTMERDGSRPRPDDSGRFTV